MRLGERVRMSRRPFEPIFDFRFQRKCGGGISLCKRVDLVVDRKDVVGIDEIPNGGSMIAARLRDAPEQIVLPV